jgi:hypothetical protein
MANRHKFKKGGRISYTAEDHVEEEAKERKFGGKVTKMGGGAVKSRFKRGGKVGADMHPFSSAHRG